MDFLFYIVWTIYITSFFNQNIYNIFIKINIINQFLISVNAIDNNILISIKKTMN